MTRIKKIVLLSTMVLTVSAASATAFAASPATTAGGVDAASLEQIKAERLELRKEILADRVDAGLLTQEHADEFITQMEERQAVCDGTGTARAGRGMGAGFGLGSNGQGGKGQGCRGLGQNQ